MDKERELDTIPEENYPYAALMKEGEGTLAALGQKGLPIGPVLPLISGFTKIDIKNQEIKNALAKTTDEEEQTA